MSPTISVIIPTLDEELHVRRVVSSALPLGPVFVVDAGSTDRTCEQARDLGATVVSHPWVGYAGQKNWALDSLPIESDWVLFLDADEWLTPDLRAAIRTAVRQERAHGFLLPRHNIFEGRLLRHAYWYPDYQLRLFRRGKGRFEDRLVHEHLVVDGRVVPLDVPLYHENRKGIDAFLRRHERYAELEAREMVATEAARASRRGGRFLGSWTDRRRALKVRVWYRLPYRPALRFVWLYIVRRGFLDGRQGLVYSQLLAAYEAMIDAKLFELRRGKAGPAEPVETSPPSGVLACPVCHSDVDETGEHLICRHCGRSYPVVDGIPVMLADVAAAGHDDLDHDHGHPLGARHKREQAMHYDEVEAAEFEIDRPHGTSKLYEWVLQEKYRRSVGPILPRLAGRTALTICGGSGMDAEFLVRSGARVIASDISLGAARRTRERARRFGLEFTAVVADAECLPFRDRSIDLVYVHDGLHHLESPQTALGEMARVARRWVSVTEPARSAATALAVRLGLALEKEEAGNRVARLAPGEVVTALESSGFHPLSAQRYAMYYRHRPGPVSHLLSRRLLFPVSIAVWRAGNSLIGRAGNKLVVVAERRAEGRTGGLDAAD